jgi:uncharacterized protein
MSQLRPVSRRRLSIALMLLLAAGFGVARSEGQEFRLFRFDKEIGSESFAVVPGTEEGALSITASSRVDLSGRIVIMNQLLNVTDRTYALRDYRVDADVQGEKQSIVAKRTADSVVVEVTAGETHLRRQFPARGDVLVLDNLVMNHLALLAMRTARRGFLPETLEVVVPQVGALMSAAITPMPPDADGSRRIEVRIGSVTEVIRLGPTMQMDGAEIASQGLRYERVGPGAPAQTSRPSPPPAKVERSVPEATAEPTRALFEEQPVNFDSKGTNLDGLLTLPRGGQKIPYPAVLFVHDAGAQDRDETIGPNRPFYEIARGLAVYGIASLRYDKRTLAAPQTIHPLHSTVQEEVIDDALAALEFLRSQIAIDHRRVWVVGHGLGGSLAPSIARVDGGVVGLVILAGSLRPLDASLRERISVGATAGSGEGTTEPVLDPDARLALAMLDSLAAGTLPETRTILGISGHYLHDYRSRDLAGDFEKFGGPALLLFGEKDNQTRQADIDSWNAAIARAGKKNATVHTLAGLGHLFIPIAGGTSPDALTNPGHVDPLVIDEIVRFILTPP